MQPTRRFKKTLLASAVLFGTGITLNASAEEFTITASGIPDVVADVVAGFATVDFGATLKGGQIGGTCKIVGATAFSDSDMLHDLNQDGIDTTLASGGIFGSVVSGTPSACYTDILGTKSGAAAIIEIDGIAGQTVSISIPDVVGTGYTYRPSDESCYVAYNNNNAVDPCTSLETGGATVVLMASTYVAENDATAIATNYGVAIEGKLRMILAGEITIDAPGMSQGTPVTDNVVVTIVYE
jgi:hypothetical protein